MDRTYGVVIVDGRPRERIDPSKDRHWHERYYRTLDFGYSQADARDEADKKPARVLNVAVTPSWYWK